MKFLLEVESDLELTDEMIPKDMFVIAYESVQGLYLILQTDNEKKLLDIAKKLNAKIQVVREIRELSKVVYEEGYRKVIDS